jgi:RimJ/RimL family protein N-acetyltransferase
MRAETRAFVDDWWAETFACPRADLWQGVRVRPHARLADYAGFWVAWRDSGVHVSTPSSVSAEEADSLATQGFRALTDPHFWSTYGAARGWVLVGPAVHSYLDEDPGDDGTVPRIDRSLLTSLESVTPEEEWRESGLGDESGDVLGCLADGRLVAAASLTDFGDQPRDIGVLVAPELRGRGLGRRVGGAAASYAIRRHGFAAWRAFVGNGASLAVSRELGFEPYAHQLAVRPAR